MTSFGSGATSERWRESKYQHLKSISEHFPGNDSHKMIRISKSPDLLVHSSAGAPQVPATEYQLHALPQ
jgi:hypothetical protein